MEYQYLSENVLTTQSLIDFVKEQTQYGLDQLMGLFPFLRADRSGQFKMVILLVRKGDTKGTFIPTQVLTCDVATGTLISRERAERFYSSLHPDVENPIMATRKNIDKEINNQYKAQILPLMDRLRLSVIETGEVEPDTYMEYLKCVLYGFTDELALVLLKISRTYITARNMKIECPDCRKSFSVSTDNLRNGQVITNNCPFCQTLIRTAYKRSGQCITYTDQYMRDYRTKVTQDAPPAPQKNAPAMESYLETDNTFVVEESLKGKEIPATSLSPEPKKAPMEEPLVPMPTVQDANHTAMGDNQTLDRIFTPSPDEDTMTAMVEEDLMAAVVPETQESMTTEETISSPYLNLEEMQPVPLYFIDEERIIDLKHQKKVFAVARHMLFESDFDTPPVIFTLKGEQGCGIHSSIVNLSGFAETDIRYISLETATEADFHTNAPCLVVSVKEQNQTYSPLLNNAVIAMKNHPDQALFITGPAQAVNSLMEKNPYVESKVLYDLNYNTYTNATLANIFRMRMAEFGIDASAFTNDHAKILFTQKNANDVTKLCGRMYFKHCLALADNRNGIQETVLSEQEIKAEITRLQNTTPTT